MEIKLMTVLTIKQSDIHTVDSIIGRSIDLIILDGISRDEFFNNKIWENLRVSVVPMLSVKGQIIDINSRKEWT